MPEGLKYIDEYAFSGCSGLMNVAIPEGVTEISSKAFADCCGITSVDIPPGVMYIRDSVFQGCSGLVGITIPSNVKSIGASAFEGCGLVNLTIPGNVEVVGEFAFRGCCGLESVMVLSGVENIGRGAFSGCSGLREIKICGELNFVGSGAFDGCEVLSLVYVTRDNAKQIKTLMRNAMSYDAYSKLTFVQPYLIEYENTKGCENTNAVSYTVLDSVVFHSLTNPPGWRFVGWTPSSISAGTTGDKVVRAVWNLDDFSVVFHPNGGLGTMERLEVKNLMEDSYKSVSANAFVRPYYAFKGWATNANGSVAYVDRERITNLMVPAGGVIDLYAVWELTSVPKPIITPTDGEEFTETNCLVSISCPLECAKIYFTTNSADLLTATDEYLYSAPFEIADTTTVWAFAICGTVCSPLAAATITKKSLTLSEGGPYQESVGGITWTFMINGDLKADVVEGDVAEIPESSAGCVEIPVTLGGCAVTSIGDKAFYGCREIKSVMIPSGVTSVGDYAFYGCSLVKITIPSSVTNVGSCAFWGNYALKDVTVPGWKCGINFSSVTNLVMSDGVTDVVDDAFKSSGSLRSVTMPASVKRVGARAFQDCGALSNVAMSPNLQYIESAAFQNCKSLAGITLPASLMSIGAGAFQGCGGLANIVISSGLLDIGNSAFQYCVGLENVTLPLGVLSIGSSAFSDCEGLTSVTIPASVTNIGALAFSNCKSLNEIAISPENSYYTFEDGVLFDKARGILMDCLAQKTGEYVIASGVTSVGQCAFSRQEGITSVIIPSSVTSIGMFAFQGCCNLVKLSVPSSVIRIGSYAFDGCRLTDVSVPGWRCGLDFSSVTNLVISDGVTSIKDDEFKSCGALETVTMPADMTSIGHRAFQDCKNLSGVVIPCSVTNIGVSAFQYCSGLTDVALPSSLVCVESSVFQGCWHLTNVTMPSKVTSIGECAFSGCGLMRMDLPEGVTNIGDRAFYCCEELSVLKIPSSVKRIGSYAFGMCKRLPNVTIPDGIVNIEEGAFYGCRGFSKLSIPPSVRSIGDNAFGNCSGLWGDLVIPSGVTRIGKSAFYYCFGVMSVQMPSSVTSIGDDAFYSCKSLTNVVFTGSAPSDVGKTPFADVATLFANKCTATVYSGTKGWDDDGDGKWQGLTLVYRDRPKRDDFSVLFHANGGTGMMERLEVVDLTEDSELFVSANAFVRPYYEFKGWATNDNGSVAYADGERVVNLIVPADGVVDLYAVWEKVALPFVDAEVGKGVTGRDEPVTVSASWVTESLIQRFGSGKEAAFRQQFGSDLAAALAKPTGKVGRQGEALTVWDDYVAGTDPTDTTSVFTATIEIVDGNVVVNWMPNLNEGTTSRLYRIKSKANLSDEWSCPPVTGHSFFTIEVDLSDGKTETARPGVVGKVSEPSRNEPYCVIDLSGGVNASVYSVSYLTAEPVGGWTDEHKTTKIVLRRIEPGTFKMNGSCDVTLTKSFYIGVFEVTQRQWELVMGTRPSYFANDECYASRPVEQVSYNMIRGSSAGACWPSSSEVDSDSFLGVLRAKTGLDFDLPTEAQWEYACRAGTTTHYNSGKNYIDPAQDANMDEVGRYCYNGGSLYSSLCNATAGTAKVGSYMPNAWGLYDMHGNVSEWCLDWYESLCGAIDPSGPCSGEYRVMHGGDWTSRAEYCTSSGRRSIYPSRVYIHFGFRISRTLQETKLIEE